MNLRVVICDRSIIIVVYRILSLHRSVESSLDLYRLIHIHVYAEAETDFDVRERVEVLCKVGAKIVIVDFAGRHIQKKLVGKRTGGHAAGPVSEIPQIDAHMLQNFVSGLSSVQLVDQMEVVYVQSHRVHLVALVESVVFIGIAVEVIPREQPRHILTLSLKDDLPVFIELDRPLHPRDHDLRFLERLYDEVRRAHTEALDLCRLLRRKHQDRELVQLRVFLHHRQNLEAVHSRHLQVEQNQREGLYFLPHYVECILAVRGIKHFVITCGDKAQQLTVYLLIVNDQDTALAIHRMESCISC